MNQDVQNIGLKSGVSGFLSNRRSKKADTFYTAHGSINDKDVLSNGSKSSANLRRNYSEVPGDF